MGSRYKAQSRPKRRTGKYAQKMAVAIIPRPMAVPNIGLTHSVKVRYASTAATQLAISWKNLLDSWVVSTAATTGFQLFDSVRIRAIEVWAYSSAGPVTATVIFPGAVLGAQGDSSTHTDTSMGIEPAYVRARPSKRSQASMFQSSSTNSAFDIFVPSGAIIDIDATFRCSMAGYAPTALTNALVAAIPGNVYIRGFDGAAAATTKFLPQGIPDVI
jgi:hypothetical protein